MLSKILGCVWHPKPYLQPKTPSSLKEYTKEVTVRSRKQRRFVVRGLNRRPGTVAVVVVVRSSRRRRRIKPSRTRRSTNRSGSVRDVVVVAAAAVAAIVSNMKNRKDMKYGVFLIVWSRMSKSTPWFAKAAFDLVLCVRVSGLLCHMCPCPSVSLRP